jgi:hypothetical protein
LRRALLGVLSAATFTICASVTTTAHAQNAHAAVSTSAGDQSGAQAGTGAAAGSEAVDENGNPVVTAEVVTRAANAEPGADETDDKLLPEAPLESPPPPPRHKGLVLESSLGAADFLGKFGEVAPLGFFMHTQLGYEIFNWLMVFGEGELTFTDTSGNQGPTQAQGFPIFGFGGGVRETVHITDRVAVFVQEDIGAMKSDITTGALANIGYKNAEALGLYFGGRVGVEWYQIDRHLALALQVGLRDALGFKRQVGSDLPLMLDAGLALRYTF